MVLNLYNRIKKYKITFKKNRHVDILMLDLNYSGLKFENYSVKVLDLSEINLYYFIPQLLISLITNFEFRNFKYYYLKRLFSSFNANVSIGHHISGHSFTYKYCMPDSIAITYQFCWFCDIDFKNYYNIHRSKENSCDYFIVYDKFHARNFSKIIRSKYLIGGSVKNNELILEDVPKIYDIMYISEYRGASSDDFYEFSIRTLGEYCKNSNKTLCIAFSSLRPDKVGKISYGAELSYYRNLTNFIVVNDKNSTELATISKMCVAVSSNLAIELLSRSIKVFYMLVSGPSITKFNPYFLKNYEGVFWYRGTDKEAIMRKLDILFNMSTSEWKIFLKQNKIQILFDPGNTILKQLVDDIINEKQKKL